ncbi:MAG: hypothetical protein ACTSR8_21180 [Promethearchaeota archaeon]
MSQISLVNQPLHQTATSKDNPTPRFSSKSGGGYIMNTEATYSWIDATSGTNMTSISDEDDECQTIPLPWR